MGLALLAPASIGSACHRVEEPEPASTSTMSNSPPPAAPSATGAPTARRAAAACPPDPEPNLPPAPAGSVTLAEATGGPAKVDVEIVKSDHDTERGLMYRTTMPEDHGMLFELDRREHPFWMHNTCIGLDIIYIDHDRIAGIVENAATLDDTPVTVGLPSTDVLEVNAGYSKRHGIRAGQRVVLPPRSR